MKIGIIASNWRPVPGGEKNIFAPGLIIKSIADGLVDLGHDVTLFAPEGTVTRAKLMSEGLKSAFEDYHNEWQNDLATFLQIEQEYEMVLLSKAFEMANDSKFDIIHVHKTNIEPFFANFINCPMVITSHNSYLKAKAPIFSKADTIRLKKYKNNCYYTALSKFIQNEVDLNFVGVVHNGISLGKYPFSKNGGNDLLYVGRMIESKGPDLAIEIAKKTKKDIKLLGDIRAGKQNQIFWEKLKEKIDESKVIDYVGFVSYEKVSKYYQDAKILVVSIREPESFGLTMVESMACGTPVIAFDVGGVREIIKDGDTGYICPSGDVEAMVRAVEKIYQMSEDEYQNMRRVCRKHVEENFSSKKMVSGYEKVYKKVLEDWENRK